MDQLDVEPVFIETDVEMDNGADQGRSPHRADPTAAVDFGPRATPLRQLGLSPNHWYVVAQGTEFTDQTLAVTFWHQPIVLYRGSAGQIHAIEDRCPHRQVKLSSIEMGGA